MSSKLFLFLSVLAVGILGQGSPSCTNACGNAIQQGSTIVCYCLPQCLQGIPGKCCDDFAVTCPAEHKAGLTMKNEPSDAVAPITTPKLPEGCKAPDSSIIPVPTEVVNYAQAGNSCKDHCSATMVDEAGNAVCYCDSNCLLTADCCPDFADVCDLDPCVLAIVAPAAQAPAPATLKPASCQGNCGTLVPVDGYQLCSCEETCIYANTCCPDFLQTCEIPTEMYPVTKDGSCLNRCGKASGDCHCDYQCALKGDCCSDYLYTCGKPAVFPSQIKTGLGSCRRKCGGAGLDCWCDDKCLSVGDCCWDFLQECQSGAN